MRVLSVSEHSCGTEEALGFGLNDYISIKIYLITSGLASAYDTKIFRLVWYLPD